MPLALLFFLLTHEIRAKIKHKSVTVLRYLYIIYILITLVHVSKVFLVLTSVSMNF